MNSLIGVAAAACVAANAEIPSGFITYSKGDAYDRTLHVAPCLELPGAHGARWYLPLVDGRPTKDSFPAAEVQADRHLPKRNVRVPSASAPVFPTTAPLASDRSDALTASGIAGHRSSNSARSGGIRSTDV